jgi:hypothetical protein
VRPDFIAHCFRAFTQMHRSVRRVQWCTQRLSAALRTAPVRRLSSAGNEVRERHLAKSFETNTPPPPKPLSARPPLELLRRLQPPPPAPEPLRFFEQFSGRVFLCHPDLDANSVNYTRKHWPVERVRLACLPLSLPPFTPPSYSWWLVWLGGGQLSAFSARVFDAEPPLSFEAFARELHTPKSLEEVCVALFHCLFADESCVCVADRCTCL